MDLTIRSVSKKYAGNIWALKDFSLTVGPGVLGLLGPNGAGKSTLMRILATVTKPTHGTVIWDGFEVSADPDRVRQVLGYLPQDFGVYPNLNAIEFLEYLAAAKGVPAESVRERIDQLLQLVNLVDVRKRPLGSYSGGMKQRVGIAQALLNDPKLLIVDEPTGGLDPEERVRFRNLLSELSGERVVILSTHIVSDVEVVATQIAIISRGQLIAHAAPEVLLRSVEGRTWQWVVASEDIPSVKQQYVISNAVRRADGVHLRVISSVPPHQNAEPVSPTLEDAYLSWMHSSRGNIIP